MKKIISFITSLAMVAAIGANFSVAAQEPVPTLRVDMGAEKHSIIHGSAGFLYGISNEGVPDVNTLTPLKPKVLATKGALGTEHPYGDALDVAEEFFQAGGEQVQMYCSNYYGVFGVTASAHDYGDVLKNIIAPAVVEWKEGKREAYPDIDSRIVYIPINEGTPINGVANFNEAWKIYYNSIKAADKNAVIAGPNDATYRGYGNLYNFLQYCRDNNCLPDVMTWHELQVSCLDTMDDHIAEYRRICNELGIAETQVVINEYADFADCGVPGRLVNWISRLEDNQVYGCLPFWHQANNLNDLTANANQGNGAWWVYKWYGDMSGKTLNVAAQNTTFDGFYGLATIDENKRSASVLCGGVDESAMIKLENLDDTAVFADDDNVHIKVEASYFTGYHGALYEPETVLEGVFAVENGTVEIPLENTLFSTAYNITVTETTDEAGDVAVGAYRASYEAEDASLSGNLIIENQDQPIEQPRYFCSGSKRVGGIDAEGEGVEYNINVPIDGLYKLSFIYGNGVGSTRNNANTHCPLNITQKLVIDGEESELLLPNTLFYSMEGMAEKYVSLKAGYHSIALKYNGDAGAFHDVLYVSYAGAYDKARPGFNKIYEAEAAEFNLLGGNADTNVRTENEMNGYSGNGYVTGLDASQVSNGGGIRWIVDVEESGLYHLNFRYTSAESGNIHVYLDNTNLTFDNSISDIEIEACDTWKDAHATIFLRQGINIIDADTDCSAAIDYMRVLWSGLDYSQTIEAESATGNFKTAASGDTVYTTEMLANDGYLEFKVNVPTAGTYKMQVFQSNNDLCGTHSYNIKIIDRYAVFEVNGDNAIRYFFPNTFSDDTFLERTIPLELEAGENIIKVYNDNSWNVLWGGSQSEPGTNKLVNYTPNFDKFVISPVLVDEEISDISYTINTSSTADGYIYSDKNTAKAGEKAVVYIVPDGRIEKVSCNGEDITKLFSTEDGNIYTAEIEISGDTDIFAELTPAKEGAFEAPQITDTDTIFLNGQSYEIVGENLFTNSDFSDNTGKGMEQWYTGVNNAGHPTSGTVLRPSINEDGTLVNLKRLSENDLLVKNVFEPKPSGNMFYFGTDSSQPAGMNHYLVEAIGEPWQSNAWNGEHSLLSYIPIEKNKNYYFHFRAYTLSGSASIRYGAINMDNYVPEDYLTTDTLNFSGSGYMECKNGDQQNVGGNWTSYDSIINSGDGDYFLFNAYWLQMAQYLCMGDFKLVELSDTPLTRITGIEKPKAVIVGAGEALTLAETVKAYAADGAAIELPVTWLNAKAVDTSNADVYTVTGYVTAPEGYFISGDPYVRQRVIVSEELSDEMAEITGIKIDGAILNCDIKAYKNCDGTLYAVSYSEDGRVAEIKMQDIIVEAGNVADISVEFSQNCSRAELFFWGGMEPLAVNADYETDSVTVQE